MQLRGLIALLVGLVGAVIGAPEEAQDISQWSGNTALFAVFVGCVVAYTRANVARLSSVNVPLFSAGVGAVLSVLFGAVGVFDGGLVEWVANGLTAGIMASMAVDVTRHVLSSPSRLQ